MSNDAAFGRFFIINPDKSKADFPITAAVLTIGSDAGNGLCLAQAKVAPYHARLEWRDGQALISELPGCTGLFVNQNPVKSHPLRQGDVVRVGDFFLVYHAPRQAPAQVPADVAGVRVGPVAVPPPPPPPGPQPSPGGVPNVVAGAVSQQNLSQSTLRIGRDPANNIVLNHLQVSRFHTEITYQGNQWYINDLRSTNGTFVNSQRISSPTPLKRGDRIRISDYSFLFDGQKLEHYSEEGNARIDAINLRRVVNNNQLILQDISLSIYPREFVAVVGGSGAGKSTLVSALSGFRPADYGVVLLNGLDYYENLEAFRSTLGYVPQDDIIHPELTTGRALHYASLLRMPEDTRADERQGRINEVLHDLQLDERRNTPITRLSGGQRKRVSIGVELLTKPRLFYLDEPTSGLDPGMEAEAMRIFRKLADQGHTLILITHATRNIMLCDKVLFLARGGYMAFYGTPAEALEYFKAEDFADIYLKVEHDKPAQQWDLEFKQSIYYAKYVAGRLQEVNTLVAQARANPAASLPMAARASQQKQGSPLRQFSILSQRYLEILSRDRVNMSILLAQAPVLACVLLILVFNQTDLFQAFKMDKLADSAALATKGKIVVFLLSFFSLMCGCINSVREIVKENPIYKRERTVNLGIVPYVLSKFLILAVVSAFQTAVFVGIIFNVVEPPKGVDDFFLLAFLTMFGINLAGVALGLAISAAVNNQNTAITSLPIVLLSQIVLSGALMALPDKAKFLSSLTIMKWGFELLGNITRLWKVLPLSGDFPGGVVPPAALAAVETGKKYAEQFDLGSQLAVYFGVLVFWVALFLVISCALQRAKDFQRD